MGKKIAFYLALPWLVLISYLPFSVIYFISDFLSFFIADILGYRKKVVYENLRHAFPKKCENDIRIIARNFYGFFADFILEFIKLYSISPAEIEKRMPFKNKELLTREFDRNQSAIVVLGHQSNWEWAGPAAAIQLPFEIRPIYKRLLNPYFDKFILKLRSRLGPEMLEMRSVGRKMVQDRDTCSLTVFPMDQRPDPNHAYWTDFMNRDAGFFQGTEKLSKKFNLPVYFVTVRRVKRGYYELDMSEICMDPASAADGEITEKMVRKLEEDIRENPELYLWSHKRWKHVKPN